MGLPDMLKPGEWGVIPGSIWRADRRTCWREGCADYAAGHGHARWQKPRVKSFTVTGLFEIGWIEADSRVALIHAADAQRLHQLGDAVTGIRVKRDLMKGGRWLTVGCVPCREGSGVSD